MPPNGNGVFDSEDGVWGVRFHDTVEKFNVKPEASHGVLTDAFLAEDKPFRPSNPLEVLSRRNCRRIIDFSEAGV